MRKVETLLPVARQQLVMIPSGALLVDAARLLHAPEVNLVVVCDDTGKMAGVISKTDVVGRISHCTGASCTMTVARIMSKNVVYCRPDEWLPEVWSVVKQRGLKNVPVVDPEMKPMGVLNARDTVQALLEDVEYEEQLLRDYVTCVGYR